MDDTPIFFNVERETPFSIPFKRSATRDARLSFGARGLFQLIWDFPTGFTPNKTHLVSMSRDGRVHLDRLIKELKEIGAIKIEAHRISSHEELARINEKRTIANKKTLRIGNFYGHTWTIIHPDAWAIETPLANSRKTPKNSCNSDSAGSSPKHMFPESRENRNTEKPNLRKPTGKVRQGKGSAIEGFSTSREATRKKSLHGILVLNRKDVEFIEGLISEFGTEKVELAASQVPPAQGFSYPYQSEVYKFLKKGNQNANREQDFNKSGDDYAKQMYGL
jgi:hypothetical protein